MFLFNNVSVIFFMRHQHSTRLFFSFFCFFVFWRSFVEQLLFKRSFKKMGEHGDRYDCKLSLAPLIVHTILCSILICVITALIVRFVLLHNKKMAENDRDYQDINQMCCEKSKQFYGITVGMLAFLIFFLVNSIASEWFVRNRWKSLNLASRYANTVVIMTCVFLNQLFLVLKLEVIFRDTVYEVPSRRLKCYVVVVLVAVHGFLFAKIRVLNPGVYSNSTIWIVAVLRAAGVLVSISTLFLTTKDFGTRMVSMITARQSLKISPSTSSFTPATVEVCDPPSSPAQRAFRKVRHISSLAAFKLDSSVRGLRQQTISAYRECDHSVLKSTTKQTLISMTCSLLAIAVLITSMFSTTRESTKWCLGWPMVFVLLLFNLSSCSFVCFTYMSFGATEADYRLVCARCDRLLLKCTLQQVSRKLGKQNTAPSSPSDAISISQVGNDE